MFFLYLFIYLLVGFGAACVASWIQNWRGNRSDIPAFLFTFLGWPIVVPIWALCVLIGLVMDKIHNERYKYEWKKRRAAEKARPVTLR